MTISNIDAYALPELADLPTSRATWLPEPARAALLIHDMQDYFLRFYDRSAQPIASMVENIRKLRSACTAAGVPVIYTAQPPQQTAQERGLLSDLWGPGLTAHPEAHQILEALRPTLGDIVLTKYRYSAFHRTGLLELLHARGRDQLFVCGVYAHIGCLMTACDAFMHDVKPFFVTDAVADFSPEYHKLAIDYAAERCAVTLTTAQLLTSFSGARESSSTQVSDRSLACGAAPLNRRGLSPELVREHVARALEVAAPTLSMEQNLFDLGLDSIRLMALVESFRGLGAEVSFVDLAECADLTQVCSLLARNTHDERPGVQA
jgi:bifunctional isochorismate lyase / aryl carrier protein